MKKTNIILLLLLGLFCACQQAEENTEKLTIIPFNKVKITDTFWHNRMKIQKETLVPFSLEKTKPAVDNLRKTGNFLKGIKDDLPFVHRFVASDLYKVMEGAAYLLMLEPDPVLEARMDSIIDIIADAQQADGYHYESHITGVSKYDIEGMGPRPYSHVVHSHELYNMGHMYEAAIAYYQATGKDKWLKVAEKNARHIQKVFFEGDPNYNDGKPVNQAPGHEEIELALVKLYRVTGDTLYLNMAKRFIDIRGVTYRPEGGGVMEARYAQQHLPVREQTTAEGHAVRATYLYSAMADISAQTGDETLQPALKSIWHNIVDTRMHITGGLGSVKNIEAIGPEYLLPNKDTYDETCAAVGNVFFNYRMFLLEKDAKYMDVAEVALFNNVLAGVNLEGNRFFYVNPLEADGITPFNHGTPGRAPWFGTACCPSNLARLIPQISGMMYAHTSNEIYCILYTGNQTEIPLADGKVSVQQTSEYPFGETVQIVLTPEHDGQRFDLKMRIPTWTGDQFVPGELYHFTQPAQQKPTLKVNGKPTKLSVHKGFATISRKWSAGDVVELTLPMPIRYSKAIEQVADDRGKICISKGPILYCAEEFGNEAQMLNLAIPENNPAQDAGLSTDERIKNIPLIKTQAIEKLKEGEREVSLSLLPYFAWNNRGNGAMQMWFPTNIDSVKYTDFKFLRFGKFKSIEASFTYGNDSKVAVGDNLIPKNSFDTSIPRWTSWPQTGKEQWIECELEKPANIESVAIYWYDDNGGVQIPVSWSLQYKENGQWKKFPLYITDQYNTFKDQFNMVHPAETITAEAIKIAMKPQQKSAVGILEINIETAK